MNVTIKLNAGQGAGLGPNFDLTSDSGSVFPSTATLTELRSSAGKSVAVDIWANTIYVTASDGACLGSPALALPIAGKVWYILTPCIWAPGVWLTHLYPDNYFVDGRRVTLVTEYGPFLPDAIFIVTAPPEYVEPEEGYVDLGAVETKIGQYGCP